jgi:DNA-binding CsgD family transcriptional regulator
MKKKKLIRAEDITEKEILSLYKVLDSLYDNPDKHDLTYELNKCLLRFVWYDFYHYLMEDPNGYPQDLSLNFDNWYSPNEDKEFSNIAKDENPLFEEKFEASYHRTIQHYRKDNPNKISKTYDYYCILAKNNPKIGLGFFRNRINSNDMLFSDEEKRVFKKLAPHLLLLYRIVLHHNLFESHKFQYFDSFSNICTKIANDFSLSKTELKLLPEILFGLSNEEIAEKNYVSVAAVKKNIKHIFKKTAVKNRIDFISKFFTSPDRVNF